MCSSFTYFLSILISPNSFNIISYISWVFGIGTWYYFVPVLFGCYVIFSISNSNWWSFFLIIINIICINLTMKGYISDIGILTKYINVFNWVGYFAIGMICKKFDLISKFNSSRLLKLFSVFFCFIMLILNVFLNINISYWGELSIITIISGVFTFLAISSSITFMNDIGKKSYAIYLLHMQIAGFLNTRIFGSALFELFKPIIILLAVYVIISVFASIIRKIHLGQYLFLIGIRI